MLRSRLVVAVLAVVASVTAPFLQDPAAPAANQAPAQQPAPGAERRASTLVVSSDTGDLRGAISIGYGQPVWREHYDRQLDSLQGNYTRLGIGWWTTFDTIGAIDVGDVRIEPGSYFLGLKVDEGMACSLLLFDSKKTMQARLLPATTALYRGDAKPEFQAPMTFARGALATPAAKLEIELSGSPTDRAAARLSIRWGKHELSAPVTLHLLDVAEAKGK